MTTYLYFHPVPSPWPALLVCTERLTVSSVELQPLDDWDVTGAAARPASPVDPGLLALALAAIPRPSAAVRAHRVLVGQRHGNPGRYPFRYPLRVPHPHPRVIPAPCCPQEIPLGLSLSSHSSDLPIKLTWTASLDLLLPHVLPLFLRITL